MPNLFESLDQGGSWSVGTNADDQHDHNNGCQHHYLSLGHCS